MRSIDDVIIVVTLFFLELLSGGQLLEMSTSTQAMN